MKKESSVQIAPSLLASDFANLQKEVEMLNASEADYLHLDIMDGRFVPNISFGIPVCEAIHRYAQKPLDVHLMIVEPEKYLEDFQKVGAYSISVHYEACLHVHRTIHQIKDLGSKAGIALNPHTPVSVLEEIIRDLDLICLLSVNPGFGGQKFIRHSLEKIGRLRKLIHKYDSPALIEVDGGVNVQNAPAIVASGADILVAGSAVFKAEDPAGVIKTLKSA